MYTAALVLVLLPLRPGKEIGRRTHTYIPSLSLGCSTRLNEANYLDMEMFVFDAIALRLSDISQLCRLLLIRLLRVGVIGLVNHSRDRRRLCIRQITHLNRVTLIP